MNTSLIKNESKNKTFHGFYLSCMLFTRSCIHPCSTITQTVQNCQNENLKMLNLDIICQPMDKNISKTFVTFGQD